MDINNLNGNFIGLFDSGFGGISVLNFLTKLLPNENYVFYADSENCPYGKRTKENLVEIGRDIISRFQKHNPKSLIIACGTMSTSDPKKLREGFDRLKIIGTYPNFEHALTKNLVIDEHTLKYSLNNGITSSKKRIKVLILATTATCNSIYVKDKIRSYNNLIDIIALPADKIVKAVENDEIESEDLKNYLTDILTPYKDVDIMVLGCTHFPFAEKVIRKIMNNNVHITSGCEVAANECFDYINVNNKNAYADKQKKLSIVIVDAKLNDKRKETFLRLLDTNNIRHNISFSHNL